MNVGCVTAIGDEGKEVLTLSPGELRLLSFIAIRLKGQAMIADDSSDHHCAEVLVERGLLVKVRTIRGRENLSEDSLESLKTYHLFKLTPGVQFDVKSPDEQVSLCLE